MRKIFAREKPLEFEGELYQIPYHGPGASGLGKPLKSILHGKRRSRSTRRPSAPASIRNSAEIADGMLPDLHESRALRPLRAASRRGLRQDRRPARAWRITTFVPSCAVSMDDDLERARLPVKQPGSLYRRHGGARKELLQ